jgi:DNA-damage-inducible protein D
MTKEIVLTGPTKDFESIKKVNEHGIEYWEARELMPLLGYVEWRKFEGVIGRAKDACKTSNQKVSDHFVGADKMVKLGSGSIRNIENYNLSRYACYLIAQNGDPRKKEIATAQTYFAVQTRKQEIFEQLGEKNKRLFIRSEVKKHNKKLFDTAKQAGVNNFGKFNNFGYLGLYGLDAEQIKERKQIGKDDILDRAGATELAANLFRITQTDEKIIKENIKGEDRANITHFHVGKEVRETIKRVNGTMPEDLSPEVRHYKVFPVRIFEVFLWVFQF